MVVYQDSTERQTAPVSALVRWADDLEVKGKKWLRVDITEKDVNAPVE